MNYYKCFECPDCGHENYVRCFNGVEHNGLPVFSPDMFSQEGETCDECGISFGTGDIDILTEDEM